MKRVRLLVSYDGTNYCGWQVQMNGITIEEVLNRELTKLLGEEITVIGASRTDAGVHALANVAVFDTETRIPAEKISFALNQRLPEDIRIQQSDQVPLAWHPRYQESIKTYEYRIYNHCFPNPIRRLYTYFVYVPLDVEIMQKAATYFLGEHDFASFCSANSQVRTTVRTIYDFTVRKEGREIVVQISGNGFLYNMVRIIVGTLIKTGLGIYAPEQMKEILHTADRSAAGPTAPACGLTLIGLAYQNSDIGE